MRASEPHAHLTDPPIPDSTSKLKLSKHVPLYFFTPISLFNPLSASFILTSPAKMFSRKMNHFLQVKALDPFLLYPTWCVSMWAQVSLPSSTSGYRASLLCGLPIPHPGSSLVSWADLPSEHSLNAGVGLPWQLRDNLPANRRHRFDPRSRKVPQAMEPQLRN